MPVLTSILLPLSLNQPKIQVLVGSRSEVRATYGIALKLYPILVYLENFEILKLCYFFTDF